MKQQKEKTSDWIRTVIAGQTEYLLSPEIIRKVLVIEDKNNKKMPVNMYDVVIRLKRPPSVYSTMKIRIYEKN